MFNTSVEITMAKVLAFDGKQSGSPLTRSTVNKLVERAGREVEFGFPVHPHMLRHACGYYLANKGVDTRTIQDTYRLHTLFATLN